MGRRRRGQEAPCPLRPRGWVQLLVFEGRGRVLKTLAYLCPTPRPPPLGSTAAFDEEFGGEDVNGTAMVGTSGARCAALRCAALRCAALCCAVLCLCGCHLFVGVAT